MLKKIRITVLPVALFMQICFLASAPAEAQVSGGALVANNPAAGGNWQRTESAMLYNANCGVCHGQAKRSQSAFLIQNAIKKNTGGMGSLKFLTMEQIQAIAIF